MKAPKEAVEACPWAVKLEDFDFQTLKSFPVWGFSSLSGAWDFADVWGRPELLERWQERCQKRKTELLGRWDASTIPGMSASQSG